MPLTWVYMHFDIIKIELAFCLICLFEKGEMCKEIWSIYRILDKNRRKAKWSHYNLSSNHPVLSYFAKKISSSWNSITD